MIRREITLECGVRTLVQAREALGSLSGVVAAELVPGRSAITLWQGEGLSEEAIRAAVRQCGAGEAHIR